MAWLKQYGIPVAGVIAGTYIAAHMGFNLGVEARTGWDLRADKPVHAEMAKIPLIVSSHHN